MDVILEFRETQKALGELRRLSGLTWDQVAKLFNVPRRRLHFWASGEPLSRSNKEQLNRLLGTIRYVDQGSASLNRSLLLCPDNNGNSLFDLLIAGKCEELEQIVGPNNAPRRPSLGPLCEDSVLSRMSPKPEELVGALQESIHREIGICRAGITARSHRNSN